MARFSFRMQSVLEERQRQEKLCQRELAERQLLVDRYEGELRQLELEVRQANDGFRAQHLVGRVNPMLLMGHRRYLGSMKDKAVQIATKMAEAKLSVEASRRKLIEAARGRKTIETLRDRQHEQWLESQNRAERNLADEIGTQLAYQNLQASS